MVGSLVIRMALMAKFHYWIWIDIDKVIILICWQTDKPCFCSYNFLINIRVNIHLVFFNYIPQEGLHLLQLIKKSVWWLEKILEVMMLMEAIYDLIQIKENPCHFSSYAICACGKKYLVICLSIFHCLLIFCSIDLFSYFITLNILLLQFHIETLK